MKSKPNRLKNRDFAEAVNDPNLVLALGTLETLFYPEDKRWLPYIETSINFILNEDYGGDSSTLGILRTADLALVANTLHLIGPVLGEEFVKDKRRELRTKVVYPFLSDYQQYQTGRLRRGDNPCFWLEMDNNWKSVCMANILYIFWVVEDNPTLMKKAVAAAQDITNEYLNSFEDNGFFSGGMRYWGYGFSHYVLLAEMLLQITNGSVDLYNHPKIPYAVTYPYQVEISGINPFRGGVFPLFGDNSNPATPYQWVGKILEERFANLTSSGDINPFASESFLAPYLLMSPHRVDSKEKISPSFSSDNSLPYSQLAIFKDSVSPLILTIKTGNNAEEHNHNDVGSYTLFYKDKSGVYPLVGDLGVEEYLGVHFSKDSRYTFEGAGSHGHPLPIVDGSLQFTGREAFGTIIPDETDIGKGLLTIDLTRCYELPGLKSVKRRVVFKEGTMVIRDSFNATYPVSFATVLPTRLVAQNSDGVFKLSGYNISLDFKFAGSAPLMVSDKPSTYFSYAQLLKLMLKGRAESGHIEYQFKLNTLK